MKLLVEEILGTVFCGIQISHAEREGFIAELHPLLFDVLPSTSW
jgi:hypothetical protein